MRGCRKFCRNGRGFRGRSPTRRLTAIAPGARPVEGVYAELVHLLHFIDPGRAHPISMVVRRLGDFRQPQPAVEHRVCDFPGAVPHVGFAHYVGDPIAGEGEMPREMARFFLVYHAPNPPRLNAPYLPVPTTLPHSTLPTPP